jgi:small-conductance mechanosensitive channel
MSVKKNTKSTTAGQMVKAFKATPSKINLQFRKEIALFKKMENKQKAELTKVQTSAKAANKKQKELTGKLKTRPNSSLRKQLSSLKKVSAQLSKKAAQLSAQINQIQKSMRILVEQQTKFSNLAKNMNQFEKQSPKKKAKKIALKKPTIEKQPTTQPPVSVIKKKEEIPVTIITEELEETFMDDEPIDESIEDINNN